MGKKRSSLDATDGDAVEYLREQMGVQLTLQNVLRTALIVYATAFSLHVAYNVYEGGHMSALHIENQQKLHGACTREEIIRTTEWQKCLKAKIEKDMSVSWTTLNHVLHTSSPCIVDGCYTLFLDFIQATGWLFIGVALAVSVLLYIVVRCTSPPSFAASPAATHYSDSRELQPYVRDDSRQYNGARLIELKND